MTTCIKNIFNSSCDAVKSLATQTATVAKNATTKTRDFVRNNQVPLISSALALTVAGTAYIAASGVMDYAAEQRLDAAKQELEATIEAAMPHNAMPGETKEERILNLFIEMFKDNTTGAAQHLVATLRNFTQNMTFDRLA